MPRRLCRLDELTDPGSRGFEFDVDGGRPERIFVVRRAGEAFGYLNRCPHTGASMEWQPDHFLDFEERFIQCGIHGAIFRIDDGFCVHGPCAGQHLTSIALETRDGALWWDDELPASRDRD